MILNILNNKKLNPVVTDLFIRDRKLNICFSFLTQSYILVPKNTKLNFTHLFILKISNKRELQQTAFNHSSYIDINNFINLYKKCTAKLYFFTLLMLLQIIFYDSERIF